MAEGRTFHQVDRMSWHDVVMISDWRRSNPPVETLLRAIAESLGIKFLSSSSAPPQEIDVSKYPDPTEEIRRAFADAVFPDGIGRVVIPERPSYG